MKIMKLKDTLYFDDEGYIWDTFEEAKNNSYHKNEAYFVRRQKVKVYTDVELGSVEYTPDEYNFYIYSMKGKFILACFDYYDYCEELSDETKTNESI